MIHFIRNKNNKSIIECDVFNDDLLCAVYLGTYSRELLESEDKSIFIKDFSHLDNLRGVWWESAYNNESINDFVREEFIQIAIKYDYNYIVD